ncbi:MAG: HigA family addiction module antitoxin [Pseudomonadota bacterium]
MTTIRVRTHPGEILLKEFMEPFALSANRLSQHLGVPLSRITEIVNGKRSVTADTAERLSLFFGTTTDFWLNLQSRYELSKIRSEKQAELERIPRCDDVCSCAV